MSVDINNQAIFDYSLANCASPFIVLFSLVFSLSHPYRTINRPLCSLQLVLGSNVTKLYKEQARQGRRILSVVRRNDAPGLADKDRELTPAGTLLNYSSVTVDLPADINWHWQCRFRRQQDTWFGNHEPRLNTRAPVHLRNGVKFLLLMDLFAVPAPTVNIYLSGRMLALRQVLASSAFNRGNEKRPEIEEDRPRPAAAERAGVVGVCGSRETARS